MTIYNFAISLQDRQKHLIFLFIDMMLVPISLAVAVMLSAASVPDERVTSQILVLAGILTLLGPGIAQTLGLPRIRLNAFESGGIHRTAILASILAMAGLAMNIVLESPLPPETLMIFAMVYLIIVVSTRMVLREIVRSIYRRGRKPTRVIVYGAGQTGQQLAAALRTDDQVELVAFVDDNPRLQSLTLTGVPVHAPSRLKELIARKEINRVVLAMPTAAPSVQARIALRLRSMGCEVHSLPSFAELITDHDISKRSTPVSISDLLGRNGLDGELPAVAHTYQAQSILVTGAGGSIGSELCRQLVACEPAHLILLDHSELALYSIEKELNELAPNVRVTPILGSVCDPILLKKIFNECSTDIVLHAAAYKHVPMVEKNVIAGLKNNVIGTRIIADAAGHAGVARFILVSSDKAVRPTNIMGASKRLAELVVQDLATRSTNTLYSMVRFGNVLGSSGSVIPLFEEQIARGGPVTLTHNDVARYFMTISEAARLVLLAGPFARGGDLFVLDMGDLVPIRKLARQMIEGAGFTVQDEENPDGDIEIKVTGLRPGEKMIEELLISPDMLTTPHPKILRAQEGFLSEIEMATALKDLRSAVENSDVEAARAVVTRWVEKHAAIAPEPVNMTEA
ncbi:nucleoside-diphosphate sugar epimerase/dehydratase [Thalassovita sp.]|uniref:polysaccharide biosynthesis protein n=1 Tax=Thalassovita sp. TaxID=1979401 RepID=UPI002B266E63|nr:nucleoside-diphosphate sugar epimerase/dehydratase [Thalassovita sp.]